MKRMILLTCLIIFTTTFTSLFAQSKFHLNLDYHYMLGFREHLKDLNLNITRHDLKMHGNSLRLIGFYSLSQQLDLGAGIGADRYEEPGYNTFPVFASVQFSPLKHHIPFFLYSNLGYALKTNNSTRGMMWDLGIGYKHMLKKHFGLKFDFGYNLKNLRENGYVFTDDHWKVYSSIRQSLSFGMGFIF